jgi:hypothetical protein
MYLYTFLKAPFGLMKYNEMERSGMKYMRSIGSITLLNSDPIAHALS